MEYLYFLQNLREGSLGWLNMFFVVISEAAIYFAPIIPAVIYFCVDKKFGSYMLFNVTGADCLTNFIKVTACVYRPWIKDSRLHIASEVEESAQGYSFPSGHSTFGGSLYGTLAVWQKKKRGFVVFCVAMALLTAFARNWLGAHTFLDVAVALVIAAVVIWLNSYLMRWIEKNPEKDTWVLIATLIGAVVLLLYVTYKPYPMDYLADGSLLVDPTVMARDMWASVGMFVAWVLGWYVDRRFIKFDISGSKKQKIIRGIVLVVIFILCYKVIGKMMEVAIGGCLGSFVRRFFTVFVATIIFPLCAKYIAHRAGK